MKILKNLFFIFFALTLFSCSGDDPVDTDEGKDPDPDPVPEVQSGIFRDSEVAGLTYETETKSGVTDSEGKFEFMEGETVTFSVGGIVIGSGAASEEMTPISIATTENASLDTQEVKNIAAFLQSLDSDSDPSNGITITEDIAAAITIDAIDFTQPIEQLLGEMVAEINLTTNSALEVVYPEEATIHLAETIGETYEAGVDVFSSFIPTLESWKSVPSTSVYWIHETNSEGQLVSSTMYEKFPERVLYEINYLEFTDNLPTKYEQTSYYYYSTGEQTEEAIVEVGYNEDKTVKSFAKTRNDGTFLTNLVISELDTNNRMTEALYYNENNEFSFREVYELSEDGNVVTRTVYDAITGGNVQGVTEFTFTEFGDIDVEVITDRRGTFTRTYSYREDNTLERIDVQIVTPDGEVYNSEIIYEEGEYRVN